MSQTDALRALDVVGKAKLLRSFVPGTSHTMTNAATYTPLVGSPITLTVLVDRDVLTAGADSGVVQPATKVTIYRADVDVPKYTETILLDTGETFKIERIETADESLSICIVVPA